MTVSTPTKPRVFRRYSNRKLYDPAAHGYIRYAEIAELVVGGTAIVVEDFHDGTDHTDITLARHLADLLRAGSRAKALALARVIATRLSE